MSEENQPAVESQSEGLLEGINSRSSESLRVDKQAKDSPLLSFRVSEETMEEGSLPQDTEVIQYHARSVGSHVGGETEGSTRAGKQDQACEDHPGRARACQPIQWLWPGRHRRPTWFLRTNPAHQRPQRREARRWARLH